ncbi:MAG: hypothetical protein M3O20_13325, partial [Acidobacteriota bacterium]|nr:hypothetical protein [Acidobacteriota bacterium]
WQSEPSTSTKKAVFSSNLYWDDVAGVWRVPIDGLGGNDFAALIMDFDGNVRIAAAHNLIPAPPTTLSTAQLDALTKFLFLVEGGCVFGGDKVTWEFGDSTSTTGDNVIQINSGNKKTRVFLNSGSNAGGGELLNSLGQFLIKNIGGTGDLNILNNSTGGLNITNSGSSVHDLDITNSGSGNLNISNTNANGKVTLGVGSVGIALDGAATTLLLSASGMSIKFQITPTPVIQLNGSLQATAYGAGALVTDASGNVSAASGYSGTITTAKLTGGGANGSMTFVNGILTAQTPAT